MRLQKLLTNVIEISDNLDRDITRLSSDSRDIQPGDLFFANSGIHFDGRQFIDQAIEKGAVAVVCPADATPIINSKQNAKQQEVPIIAIHHLPKRMGEIAARFYNEPSEQLTVIGITGTNGKTSCCLFLATILEMMGTKSGVISTIGCGTLEQLTSTQYTTPDPITIQKTLAEMRDQGVTTVIMEVSSHALDQERHSGITFDIVMFTNLTRDHLDYHGDMQAYGQAKRKLFELPGIQHAIINLDDDFGRQLVKDFYDRLPVYAYSADGRMTELELPIINAHHANISMSGITASIHTPWGDGVMHSSLLGHFNLSNLLAVITTLGIMQIPFSDILNYVARLNGVPGRMELFGGGAKPFAVVDFAHTPDALQKVLMALREYCQGEIWCVFGCGGERDKGKRPLMGQCAEIYADRVVVTDDNPRHESPQNIVANILEGMQKPESVVVEHDRRRAIAHALSCAKAGDIVLIAGKGHEKYQQHGDEKLPFSDQIEVQMILAEKNHG